MKRFRNITIALIAIALIGADATNAWKQVRVGLAAFRDGDFASADSAFEKAESIQSDNRPQQASRIRFNRGCAKAALDEADEALEFFRDAARDRAAGLSADAHYNMGCLAADRAKAVFGNDPAAADVKTREDGLRHLQTAIVHYRDTRRIDARHQNAPHNLEVIRLWIKQMQAVWDQRDRQKTRDEKDLLQFLVHIEKQQLGIRQLVQILEHENDSPRRRQSVMDLEARQRDLAKEIGPLKEKIRTQFEQQTTGASAPGGAASGGGPPDPEMLKRIDEAIEQLSDIADQAGDAMLNSAGELESQLLAEAIDAQELALKQLLDFYLGIAPFPQVLDRSIPEQQQLVSDSPATSVVEPDGSEPDVDDTNNEGPDDENTDDVIAETTHSPSLGSAPAYDSEDAGWRQSRISEYAGAIAMLAPGELKASGDDLKAVEQQLAELPDDEAVDIPTDPANDESARPKDDADNSETPDETQKDSPEAQPSQREQLLKSKQYHEDMVAAMQLATDYGPLILKRTQSATEFLQTEDYNAALSDQTEALRMLREIKDAMPKKDPEQDQKNDDQQNDQDQPQDEDKQGNDDDSKNEDKDEKQQDQEQDSKQSDQQEQKQQKKTEQASREQAEAILRKVRERERKHRELQDKFRRALMIRGQVERDW